MKYCIVAQVLINCWNSYWMMKFHHIGDVCMWDFTWMMMKNCESNQTRLESERGCWRKLSCEKWKMWCITEWKQKTFKHLSFYIHSDIIAKWKLAEISLSTPINADGETSSIFFDVILNSISPPRFFPPLSLKRVQRRIPLILIWKCWNQFMSLPRQRLEKFEIRQSRTFFSCSIFFHLSTFS